MRVDRTIVLSAALATLSCSVSGQSAINLIQHYNIVVFGDMTVTGGATDGRLLVGQDFTANGWYAVGGSLSTSTTRDDLIVGNSILLNSSMSVQANVAYGNSLSGTGTIFYGTLGADANQVSGLTLQGTDGNTVSNTGFSITQFSDEMKLNSTYWGGWSEQGVVENELVASTLTLIGNDSVLNVFNLDPGAFNINGLTINLEAPNTSTVLINIPDTIVSRVGGSLNLTDVPGSQILLNLYNAEDVTVEQMSINASLLAAHAFTATVSGGNLNGQAVFGGDLNQASSWSFNNTQAILNLETIPEASTVLPALPFLGFFDWTWYRRVRNSRN